MRELILQPRVLGEQVPLPLLDLVHVLRADLDFSDFLFEFNQERLLEPLFKLLFLLLQIVE